MVFKVAKANPPAIIYLENAEMVFAKKIPKDDLSDPKRIKKDLLKQYKSLSADQRVMIIGTSTKPWDGEAKVMSPVFEKTIWVPKPDYQCRYVMWRDFITSKSPTPPVKVNFSLLAKMSAGLATGEILYSCERVLTARRIKLVIY